MKIATLVLETRTVVEGQAFGTETYIGLAIKLTDKLIGDVT